MWQQILQQLEERINHQMKEKFGLTEDQSVQAGNVLRETIQTYFEKVNFKNPQLFQALIENFSSLQDNDTIAKMRENISRNLQERVGLTAEKANAIRDFSISEFLGAISSEFVGENGKLDIQKVLAKINIQEFEQIAKTFLDGLGDRLKK